MNFPGGSEVKNPPAVKELQEMQVWSLSREDPLEEAIATLLQYSCLDDAMDRGTWQATVHRLAKSWTWLKQLSTHTHIYLYKKGVFI